MDDAWFLSFAHNHVEKGIEKDICFGSEPGGAGFGGVSVFGKTYSFLYGTILGAFGWTRANAHCVSILLIALSALCWYGTLDALGYGPRLPLIYALALPLMEPLFGAANQARPDALCFLLVSASVFLFSERRYSLSALAAAVSLEVHPAGIASFLFVPCVAAARAKSARRGPARREALTIAAKISAGLALGTLYYLALHGGNFDEIQRILSLGNAGGEPGIRHMLYEYFFRTKYLRHLPELALIIACAVWFLWKRQYRKDVFTTTMFAAALAFTLIIRRPNFMYTIYPYAAFLLLVLAVFEMRKRLPLACAVMLIYLLPQYAFVYKLNRQYDFKDYLARLSEAVPRDQLAVVGPPNAWFAFQDRPFYVSCYHGDFGKLKLASFYLVSEQGEPESSIREEIARGEYHCVEMAVFTNASKRVVVEFCRQPEDP